MPFAGSFSSASHASSPVRACVLARYLDDLNVQVLDGSAVDPVALLCPHLLHRVADSGRARWPPPSLMSMLRQCTLVHVASAGAKKLLMNAFCRADWELPISLSRNLSKRVSAAMSLPLIALRRPPFPSSRACAWP